MNKKVEKLEINPKQKKDIKEYKNLIIIFGATILIIIIALVCTLAKDEKVKDKEEEKTEETTSASQENSSYVIVGTDLVNRSVNISEGIITVTLTNNTDSNVTIDKVVFKNGESILYETTEQTVVYVQEPTYISIVPTESIKTVEVFLYKNITSETKEDNKEGPEENLIDYEYVCKGKSSNSSNYTSTMYYSFTFDKDLIKKEAYELLKFNDIDAYYSFDANSYQSASTIASIDKDAKNLSVKYSYSFHFQKTSDTQDEESYVKYVEEQGFECEKQE